MKKILCALLVLMMVLPVAACSGKEQITLNVLNWGDYIDTAVLKQFEQETGIKVKYTTMTSNEEMIVKLSAADCIYDVCFPSDYIIEKLVQQNLLYEINKDNIPNYSNIDERFLDLPFDPGNKYSVPYFWGTVGILYNTTKVSAPIDSWDALWDEQYKGQILMYDSVRDSIGITLIKLGYNINTRNEAEVMEAQQALIAQKPLVKAYLTDDIKMEMINGNGAMAVVYSGDALACISENPDLAYVVPKEGSNVWFDNIIIPKSSQHTDQAEQFINFLCDAEIGKTNTEYVYFSTPNKATLSLLDESFTGDLCYNPSQEILDRCTVFSDLGDFINVFTDAWTKIKAA